MVAVVVVAKFVYKTVVANVLKCWISDVDSVMFVNRIREMVSFKRYFSSCHERGTKKKFLSLNEKSNLRPSDSAFRCSTTEPQRLYGE